jgi:hypothetical protein
LNIPIYGRTMELDRLIPDSLRKGDDDRTTKSRPHFSASQHIAIAYATAS